MFDSAAALLRKKLARRGGAAAPRAAVLLGSGMSGALSSLEGAFSVPYEKLAGFPAARVEGHAGRLDCGAANGVPVVVFRGRFHLYEGRTPTEVAAPVRLAKALGASVFIQASAAGGIGKGFLPGSLALVRDHINFTGSDPLASVPLGERRPPFLDMSEAYAPALRARAKEAARKVKISLKEGVLAVTHGPTYETPAEVRHLERAGAHAVCMSGLCESVFARTLDLPTLFFLVITNRAAGLSKKKRPLAHEDVLRRAEAAQSRLSRLLEALLPRFQ